MQPQPISPVPCQRLTSCAPGAAYTQQVLFISYIAIGVYLVCHLSTRAWIQCWRSPVTNRIHSKLLWYEWLVSWSHDTSCMVFIGCTWNKDAKIRARFIYPFYLWFTVQQWQSIEIASRSTTSFFGLIAVVVRLTSSLVWLGTWALGEVITSHVPWYNYSFGLGIPCHVTWHQICPAVGAFDVSHDQDTRKAARTEGLTANHGIRGWQKMLSADR